MRTRGAGDRVPDSMSASLIDDRIDLRAIGLPEDVTLSPAAEKMLRVTIQSYWEALHYSARAVPSNDIVNHLERIEKAATALGDALGSQAPEASAALARLELENHLTGNVIDMTNVRLACPRLARLAAITGQRFPLSAGGRPREPGFDAFVLGLLAVIAPLRPSGKGSSARLAKVVSSYLAEINRVTQDERSQPTLPAHTEDTLLKVILRARSRAKKA